MRATGRGGRGGSCGSPERLGSRSLGGHGEPVISCDRLFVREGFWCIGGGEGEMTGDLNGGTVGTLNTCKGCVKVLVIWLFST